MNLLIADHSLAVRLDAFLTVFVVLAVRDRFAPRRAPQTARYPRWLTNPDIDVTAGARFHPLETGTDPPAGAGLAATNRPGDAGQDALSHPEPIEVRRDGP